MRIDAFPLAAAQSPSVPTRTWTGSPAALICAALILALVFLGLQIASVLAAWI